LQLQIAGLVRHLQTKTTSLQIVEATSSTMPRFHEKHSKKKFKEKIQRKFFMTQTFLSDKKEVGDKIEPYTIVIMNYTTVAGFNGLHRGCRWRLFSLRGCSCKLQAWFAICRRGRPL
jgi:hypothetical protein